MADYERLRRSSDFERIKHEGRLLKGSLMLIRLAPGLEGITRVGCIVSKKNGNAVKRNRVKRMFRAAARAAAKLPEGYDMVFIPRSAILVVGMKSGNVTRELERLLS
jgi:ribonuclease P protein component